MIVCTIVLTSRSEREKQFRIKNRKKMKINDVDHTKRSPNVFILTNDSFSIKCICFCSIVTKIERGKSKSILLKFESIEMKYFSSGSRDDEKVLKSNKMFRNHFKSSDSMQF